MFSLIKSVIVCIRNTSTGSLVLPKGKLEDTHGTSLPCNNIRTFLSMNYDSSNRDLPLQTLIHGLIEKIQRDCSPPK